MKTRAFTEPRASEPRAKGRRTKERREVSEALRREWREQGNADDIDAALDDPEIEVNEGRWREALEVIRDAKREMERVDGWTDATEENRARLIEARKQNDGYPAALKAARSSLGLAEQLSEFYPEHRHDELTKRLKQDDTVTLIGAEIVTDAGPGFAVVKKADAEIVSRLLQSVDAIFRRFPELAAEEKEMFHHHGWPIVRLARSGGPHEPVKKTARQRLRALGLHSRAIKDVIRATLS